jgi:hypothetical protein
MSKSLAYYFLGVLILSLMLLLAHGFVLPLLPEYNFGKGRQLILIFAFIFLFLHAFTVLIAAGKTELFTQLFLIQTTLKILFLLTVFLLLARKFPDEKFSMTGLFFLSYVFLTLHDLYWLLRFVKKNQASGTP